VFVNRLVGTVIVLVAAIVFIPNILDGEKVQLKEGFKTIPDRPEFKKFDLQAPPSEAEIEGALPVKSTAIEDIVAEDHLLAEESNPDSDELIQQPLTADEQPNVSVSVVKPEKSFQRPSESNLTDFAYVIQLGSFSDRGNVDNLLAKLKGAGFTAFTRPVETPSGTLTKVYVGPELEKEILEAQLIKLKALTKLNGKVTVFEIAK
jgi:DedD protein